jgi:hypothetical protein
VKLTIVANNYRKRRADKRIPCNPSRVRITAEGDLTTVEGYVLDVSKSGLRLRTDRYFPRARNVAVEMSGLLIRGSIRYCCAQKENPRSFDLGLRID